MIFLVGFIGVLIVLALGVMVFSLIVALVGAAVAIGAAAMAGVAAGLLATAIAQSAQVAEPALLGVPVGIAVFLALAALLLRRMFNVRAGAKRLKVKVRDVLPQALPEALSEPEPVERDAKVRAAWTRARDLVPEAALAQVVRARADCAALLDMADGEMLDPALIDLAAMLRRNVPALVQQVDALWRTAPRAEQAELGQGLAEDLARMGAAARPFVDRRRETLRDGLAALRNHVAAQTRE